MKKYFLLLTIFGQLLPTSSAKSYSWTGMHLKLLPAYSNLKLNYSGDVPYKMRLTNRIFNFNYSRFPDRGTIHKIAEKVSVNTLTLDYSVGLSAEISDSIGIMGEIGGTIGKTSNFIDSSQALLFNSFVTAGLFYHQPTFRIYGMGGLGFGKDIFGYPNAVEYLVKNETVRLYDNDNLINSSAGLTYRGSIGFDYKAESGLLLGISYTYTRSKTNATLKNEESFYISNHAFAATIGVHM